MELNSLQEIFILLENEKQVPLFRLNRWGQKSKGVLGKLTKAGWVSSKIIDNEKIYCITQKGEDEFDNILRPLRTTGNWDNKWRLVIFNLPESMRDVRDRLRRQLTKLGMGIMQNSVWISPNNILEEVNEFTKKLKINSMVKCFEVTRNPSIDKNIIEKSWNLPELEYDYKEFNLHAQRKLIIINKDPNKKFTAKKLIFLYALILQKDPILPWELRNRDPIRRTAHDLYLKLRAYTV